MDPSLAHLISWGEATKGDVPPPLTVHGSTLIPLAPADKLQGPSISISPLGAPHPPTIFLFGGKIVQNRRLIADMWAMDLTTRTWEKVDAGAGPGPRYFHSMDSCRSKGLIQIWSR